MLGALETSSEIEDVDIDLLSCKIQQRKKTVMGK